MELRKNARPLAMLLLVITLCALAIGEACGYSAPTWFLSFAIGIAGEWFVERGVRKTKYGDD